MTFLARFVALVTFAFVFSFIVRLGASWIDRAKD